MTTTRDCLSRFGLTTVTATLSLCGSPVLLGDPPAGTPPALTTEQRRGARCDEAVAKCKVSGIAALSTYGG